MKKFTEIIGCLLFLAIGVGISLSTLSPPKTGYKTMSAASLTPSLIGFQQFPLTIGNDVKEKEIETVHDTVFKDTVVYKKVPHILVVAPKMEETNTVDTDTSILPKEATPDTTLHPVKIPVLVSVNDSIVYSDSVNVK